ncbi:hypothetical protein C8R45DRAFT_1073445 [Mycena sanguinolenta]|nr:hypothetical protein C8R45DRAFT_1073445 [Mycena sanguinolenta]
MFVVQYGYGELLLRARPSSESSDSLLVVHQLGGASRGDTDWRAEAALEDRQDGVDVRVRQRLQKDVGLYSAIWEGVQRSIEAVEQEEQIYTGRFVFSMPSPQLLAAASGPNTILLKFGTRRTELANYFRQLFYVSHDQYVRPRCSAQMRFIPGRLGTHQTKSNSDQIQLKNSALRGRTATAEYINRKMTRMNRHLGGDVRTGSNAADHVVLLIKLVEFMIKFTFAPLLK